LKIKNFLMKIISFYLCRYKNVQDFFAVAAADMPNQPDKTNREFFDIGDFDEFEKICAKYKFTVPDADCKKRFESKAHFCVLTENGHYGCWGWYTTAAENFRVLEIDRVSPIPQNASVLFHYYTNENYRRQGYYTELLKSVVHSCAKEFAIIYAYDTNPASSGAIKKSGFRYMGRLSHKTFKSFESLISDYKAGVVEK
jgi:hypothetical protein